MENHWLITTQFPTQRGNEKANPIHIRVCWLCESGWLDSNQRPRRPERRTLPDCATSRISYQEVEFKNKKRLLKKSKVFLSRNDPDANRGEPPWKSGRQDSNLRPLAPHASALPGCATSRKNTSKGFSGAAKVGLFSIFPNQKQPLSSPLNETTH